MSNHPGINAALFNFCCAVDDGPRENADRQLPVRDPAELQWLREALEAVEAPERVVKRCLEVVLNEQATDSELIESLEELSDLVEDINWAVEFSLMNGPVIVLRMLECDARSQRSSEIRRLLALVIAHASQQNDKVQDAFNAAKWADVVVPLARREDDMTVLAALLHACSCMCRECDQGSAAFLQAKGIELLTRLLSPAMSAKISEKIANRVLFLVSYFSQIGVSSEALIEHLCGKVTSGTATKDEVAASSSDLALAQRMVDDEISISAARILKQLHEKSPSLVSEIVGKRTSGFLDVLVASVTLPDSDSRVVLRAALRSTNNTEDRSATAPLRSASDVPRLL